MKIMFDETNDTNHTNEPVLTPGEWAKEFAGGAAIMGAWILVMWAMAVAGV